MKGILFSGGSITDYSIAEKAVKSADIIICADSGILHAERVGVVPDIWVGDLDSTEGENHNCKRFIRLPAEKDDTDTMYAARMLVESGVDSAQLFGCTGTRLDHTYANLFVLKYLLDNGVDACVEDKNNHVFLLKNGSVDIPVRPNCFLSVLPFCCTAKGVNISGVKYSLEGATLSDSHPIGVSNQITKDTTTLSVNDGCLAVFLSRD